METQTLLVIVITLLALNLLLVGFYIVLVLKEVRANLTRLNRILETVEGVTSNVAAPILGVGAALGAFKSSGKVFKIISRFLGEKEEKKAQEEET